MGSMLTNSRHSPDDWLLGAACSLAPRGLRCALGLPPGLILLQLLDAEGTARDHSTADPRGRYVIRCIASIKIECFTCTPLDRMQL